MNLKNYFGEIKHFLKENVDDFDDFYDFEDEDEDEDTGETPLEDKDADQGKGDASNPPPMPPSPSDGTGLSAGGTTAGADLTPSGAGVGTQPTGTNVNTDLSPAPKPTEPGEGTTPQEGGQEEENKSAITPDPQVKTEKFGTILNKLKGLFDSFEQAKKAAGFETIDDVKKAAQENPAANSGGNTNSATANTGGGTPVA